MEKATDLSRAWVERWRAAAPELELQRELELRALTPSQALAASEALLSLYDPSCLSPERRMSSGLVEQQATLHRLRR
jgi:hypothetical protein